MESQRNLLIIGLMVVSVLIYLEWGSYQQETAAQASQPVRTIADNDAERLSQQSAPRDIAATTYAQLTDSDVPQLNTSVPALAGQSVSSSVTTIEVTTDTLDLTIRALGGDIIDASLVTYKTEVGSTENFQLLSPNLAELYIAQSGLIGPNGPDSSRNGRPVYQTLQTNYEMVDDVLVVPLIFENDDLLLTKTYRFTRGSHAIEVKNEIKNKTDRPLQLQPYQQLKQTLNQQGSNMFMPTFRGSAYSTEETKFEKLTFSDITDDDLRLATKAGWVAMLEHYFVTAWVPNQTETNTIYTRTTQDAMGNDDSAIIGISGSPINVQPNETVITASTLYMGPKDQTVLANLARGLDLTVDYGILFFISQPLFSLLKFLHDVTGNWGIAIILITLIMKGATYWLTKKQYESFAKLRELGPKMTQLKERYGDDRQKMSQAMMELYKKEKVNPMGGCFPMLLQMPIFLALYWVFLESVELRHAEFFLWINDLSVRDPYFVLPLLTGASMYFLQRLQPMTTTDEMQKKIMQFMPVMMTVFFLWFPAGLVLYWLVTNLVTLAQAKMIYAAMDRKGLKSS